MAEMKTEKVHKVTYAGTYFAGRDTKPYTVTINNVPEEVIVNANAIGWFKDQLRHTDSEHYKLFVENYTDFERLATYTIKDISELETVQYKE